MGRTMRKNARRWWQYFAFWTWFKMEEKMDPKIQLQQAILEAQEQHRRLTQQAAAVVGNQKQTELRLNRAMDELDKLSANARQAVIMADEAAKKGDDTKVSEYTTAAESFANRLIQLEAEVEEAVDTLGGLAFVLAGQVPAVGAMLHHPSGWCVEVTAADATHVTRLRLHRPDSEEEAVDE